MGACSINASTAKKTKQGAQPGGGTRHSTEYQQLKPFWNAEWGYYFQPQGTQGVRKAYPNREHLDRVLVAEEELIRWEGPGGESSPGQSGNSSFMGALFWRQLGGGKADSYWGCHSYIDWLVPGKAWTDHVDMVWLCSVPRKFIVRILIPPSKEFKGTTLTFYQMFLAFVLCNFFVKCYQIYVDLKFNTQGWSCSLAVECSVCICGLLSSISNTIKKQK